MITICPGCGKRFMKTGRQKYCSRQCYIRSRNAVRRESILPRGCKTVVSGRATIVSDPDAESGFFPGAEIERNSVKKMLSYGVFTPGTVLESGGESYTVRGQVDCAQWLELV